MTSHLIIAGALLAAALTAGWIVQLAIRRRSGQLVGALTGPASSLPTVLYFTSENCAPCRLQQIPALDALRKRVGDGFELLTIDVAENVEIARRYRVLSAPTTIVIDSLGTVRAVNVGVASAETLQKQLA
jgi:thiol-disulfide isomerase/thioredoxin